MDDYKQLTEKLLKSGAVNSLVLETRVYEAFLKKKWEVTHSPYYNDVTTGKDREIDVTATKYWTYNKTKFSCRIHFLIECKSLKDYHIIVGNPTNRSDYFLNYSWIGEDCARYNPILKTVLYENGVNLEDSKFIIDTLNSYCIPNNAFRNIEYHFPAFEIRAFNTYRETNVVNTKDMDNSVIWKSYQSITSCIKWFEKMIFENAEFYIKSSIHNPESPGSLAIEISDSLMAAANHFKILHPVIVVESNLWELNGANLDKLNYFRLCFQQLYDTETWVDIVHIDHLDEYIKNLDKYEDFLNSKI